MSKPTPAIQDYLKGIYNVSEDRGGAAAVSTKALAERMGVSAASSTNMLKKLGSLGLVESLPHRAPTC